MANENSKEKRLFQRYSKEINDLLLSDDESKSLYAALTSGETTYLRQDRVENTSFDLTWIQVIEDCLYDLGTIVKNPKIVTKTDEELVPVELARKTGMDSVKHLASHSQFIKEIEENGDVIPSKILNIGNDDEYHTYENRFIATLIRRLVLFVDKRYEFIKDHTDLHDQETLYIKNHSVVNGAEVSLETKVKVVSPKEEKVRKANEELLDRVTTIRKYLIYYYRSDFMAKMKNERDVRNPILQTNIIRKNPQYHHCFRLYRFIESYDLLGANYFVKETFSVFSPEELKELNCLMLANYLSLQGKDKSLDVKEKESIYKPKILTSSDDEQFEYGPYYNGPIQFVRVDAPYRKYLESKANDKELPKELSDQEKQYYQKELQQQSLSQEQVEEEAKLLERKSKDKIVFDAHVRDVIARRDREEEEYREYLVQKRLREEAVFLNRSRLAMVEEARKFKFDLDTAAFISYSYMPDVSQIREIEENAYNYKEISFPKVNFSLYEILTNGTNARSRGATGEDLYRYLTAHTEAKVSPGRENYRSLVSSLPLEQEKETYVVLTLDGYLVGEEEYSYELKEAKRFSSKGEADCFALLKHGRSIRL